MKPVFVLRHTPQCPLGSIADALDEAGLAYQHVDLFADVPKRLPLEDSSGLIVLGGPMSASDVEQYPFLLPELTWIREAVDAEVPILGVCLGAQLLAKSLGGKVYPNHVKEIGWYEIEVLPQAGDDRLFGGCQAAESSSVPRCSCCSSERCAHCHARAAAAEEPSSTRSFNEKIRLTVLAGRRGPGARNNAGGGRSRSAADAPP